VMIHALTDNGSENPNNHFFNTLLLFRLNVLV